MKFDLSRLGPREFENLTQSLAISELGSGITVFGPGPDGGREATFHGPIKLTTIKAEWDGYGVLQAKYREELATPSKDATWLIDQIRKEMEAWKNSAKRTPKPDYILFATNVSLSGVSSSGGLDRVQKELDKQCKSLGMRGSHIWHSETICRLLELHPTVRTSYAAWVLPGDILSEIHSHVSTRKKEVGKALQRYIAKELTRDLHVNLDQAGSADDLQIPLADVFIDLPMGFPGDHHDGATSNILRNLITTCDRNASKGVTTHDHENRARYVVIGGPGQGKSTVSQFLCQLYRAKLLDGTAIGRGREVKKAIRVIASHAERENLVPNAHRWPVKIPLTQLADELAHSKSKSLLQFIAARATDAADVSISAQDLREWLSEFPWLLLLDGLDEVPASSNRDQVLSIVNEFIMDIDEVAADVVIVATTRPQGYTEEFSPKNFRHVELKPLNKERALHYARKLAIARHGDASDRTERVLARLSQAADEASTSRLMSSPLQVTIMAVLLDRMGKVPKDRYTLFKDYYRVIYERELEKEGPSTNLLRDHRADIDAIHADVGLFLQTRSERSGDTESRLNIAEFVEIIRERLTSEGNSGAFLDSLTHSIRKAATDRLVFLVPSRANEVGFEIRSLQEFWAADALMSASDEDVRERLRTISASSHWRNVLLFAVGKIFADRRHLRDSVSAVVAELNSYSRDPKAPTRNLLLGSRLAVDVLADGLVKAPKHEAVLVNEAMKLLAGPATDDLERLGPPLSETGLQTARGIVEDWLGDGQKITGSLLAFLSSLTASGDSWARQKLSHLYDTADSAMRDEFLQYGFEFSSDEILKISAKHLLNLPISRVSHLMAIRWTRDFPSKCAISGAPPWFNHIASYEYHRGPNEWASLLNLGSLKVNFCSYKYDEHPLWQNFDTAGVPEGHWIREVLNFHAHPSENSLGRAVKSLSENSKATFRMEMFPWPVAAVLQDYIDEIISADELEDPRFVGNPEYWRYCENSWAETSAPGNVFSSFVESVRDRSFYFPYPTSSIHITDPMKLDGVGGEIEDFCNALTARPAGRARGSMAQVVLSMYGHFSRGNLSKVEIHALMKLTEQCNDSPDPADLSWIGRSKKVDREFAIWLDSVLAKSTDNWIHNAPFKLTQEWIREFSLVHLGALVVSSETFHLTKTMRRSVSREWERIKGECIDIRHRAVVCLAGCSFLPCPDEAEKTLRTNTLAEGVRAGVLNLGSILNRVDVSQDALQQKLVIDLLQELEVAGHNDWELGFDRIISEATSIPTSVDFATMRER